MVCLSDDRENGELQVPFQGSLRFTVGSRKSPIYIVSGHPDTKRSFHRRFAKFLTVYKSIIET